MPLKPGGIPGLPPFQFALADVSVGQSGSVQLPFGLPVGGFKPKASWSGAVASGRRHDLPVLHYPGGPGMVYMDTSTTFLINWRGREWGAPGNLLDAPRSVMFTQGIPIDLTAESEFLAKGRLFLINNTATPDNMILSGIPLEAVTGFAGGDPLTTVNNATVTVAPEKWVGGDFLRFWYGFGGRYAGFDGMGGVAEVPGSIDADAAQLALAIPRFRKFRTVFFKSQADFANNFNAANDHVIAALLAAGDDVVVVEDPDGVGITDGIFEAQVNDFWKP